MTEEPLTVRCARCGALNRVPAARAHQLARCGRCHGPLAAPAPLTVTDATFEATVLASPLPVLLDCWAPWCGPCRALAPVVEAIAAAYAGSVRVAKLNVDENPGVAGRFAIQGIPTLLFFEKGQLRDRLVGAHPRALIEERLRGLLAAA
jgi:thioredoxin 2